MGKQDIIKYVMETPHNTNPKLLKQKIEDNFTWDEIANKPFYEEKVERVVVDKWMGISNKLNSYDPVPFTLKPETQYAVYFDGVRYACATGRLWEGDTRITLSYQDEFGGYSPFQIDAALDEANVSEGYIQCPVGNHKMSIYEIVDDKEVKVYTYPNGVTGYWWYVIEEEVEPGTPEYELYEALIKPGHKYIIGLNGHYYEFVSRPHPEYDDDVIIGNYEAGILIEAWYNTNENGERTTIDFGFETTIPGPIKLSVYELTNDLQKIEILPEHIYNEVMDISFPMSSIDFVEGETYIVDFNGTKYECVAQKPNEVVFFGNLSLVNNGDISFPDTGEPFLILKSYDEVYIYMFEYVYAIVSISKVENVVHTIDRKYIKDMYGTESETITLVEDLYLEDPNLDTHYWDSVSKHVYNPSIDKVVLVVDGITYTPEPSFNDEDGFYNWSIWPYDDDKQFAVSYNIWNEPGMQWYGDGSIDHVMSAYVITEVVHPIDPKYLYDAVITTEAGEIHPNYLKWEVGDFDSLSEKYNNGGRPRVLLDTRFLYGDGTAGGIFEACGVAHSVDSFTFLFWSIDSKFYEVIYNKNREQWSVYRSDRIETTEVT